MLIEKQENGKTNEIIFIDNVKSIASSLSSLTVNLAKSLLKGKCKDYKSRFEYMTASYDLLTLKCMDCNKNL